LKSRVDCYQYGEMNDSMMNLRMKKTHRIINKLDELKKTMLRIAKNSKKRISKHDEWYGLAKQSLEKCKKLKSLSVKKNPRKVKRNQKTKKEFILQDNDDYKSELLRD